MYWAYVAAIEGFLCAALHPFISGTQRALIVLYLPSPLFLYQGINIKKEGGKRTINTKPVV
jgi:hypothetical protein